MKYELLKNNDITEVTLKEIINFNNTSDLRVIVLDLLEETDKLLIDMVNVPTIDSSGIGVLVELTFKYQKRNAKIALINVSDKILRVFKMANLLPAINIFDDKESAVEFLNR